jgi:hypothetical protein
MQATYRPKHYIGEAIEVYFDHPPVLEKKPGCPDAFIWRGERYAVRGLLSEWHDYERRGRYSNNMQETHLKTAARRGSWGVGQYYFRVLTDHDGIYDLYYDRAPKGSDQRKGAWFLDKEVEQVPE